MGLKYGHFLPIFTHIIFEPTNKTILAYRRRGNGTLQMMLNAPRIFILADCCYVSQETLTQASWWGSLFSLTWTYKQSVRHLFI